ncbi:glutaredoxin family protein [Tessaracoccus terricola]
MKERNIAVATSMLPLALAVVLVLTGDVSPWWALAAVLLAGALAWFMLRRGRHTPWARAGAQVGPGHAVVFWKPGCMYCERLLRALGNDNRITWVNVWKDADANTELRRHNDGDELTPTALVGDGVLRNPSADELQAALS